MHEMTIAQNIVNLAEKAARESGAGTITRIDIQIGELAGVLLEALEFSLKVAVRHSLAADAEITIESVPGEAVCSACGTTFPLSQRWAVCPTCESIQYTILSGEELKIKTIEVETHTEGVNHV